jgi:ATP-dependent DNA ligase
MVVAKRRPARPPKTGFVATVDPTLVDTLPSAVGWVHEVKWDGDRCQAHLQAGCAQLFTRAGNDWTARFGALPEAELDARDAIVDGEVVAIGPTVSGFGSTSWFAAWVFRAARSSLGFEPTPLTVSKSSAHGWH